jgi:hypothetical protein
MPSKNLLLLAIVGVALQACQTVPGSGGSGSEFVAAIEPCKANDNRNHCYIRVLVQTAADGKCSVDVFPGQYEIGYPLGAKNLKIQWWLDDGTPYTFPLDGIAFKKNTDREFWKARQLKRYKVYEWENKNNAKQNYEYTINVSNEQASPPVDCKPYDPWINNQ